MKDARLYLGIFDELSLAVHKENAANMLITSW